MPPPNLAPQRLAHSLVHARNDIDQVPRLVIWSSHSRTGITFHNPGTEVVLVFPEIVLVYGPVPRRDLQQHPLPGKWGHNEPLHPTVAQLGGGFRLNPAGGTLFFGGPTCQQAWQALALSGGCNPLTIMEQT